MQILPGAEGGVIFNIRGNYSINQLQRKFLSLDGICEDGLLDENLKYRISVQIVETDEPAGASGSSQSNGEEQVAAGTKKKILG